MGIKNAMPVDREVFEFYVQDAAPPRARRHLDRRRHRPRAADAREVVARARRPLPHRPRGQRAPRPRHARAVERRAGDARSPTCATHTGRRVATAAEARAHAAPGAAAASAAAPPPAAEYAATPDPALEGHMIDDSSCRPPDAEYLMRDTTSHPPALHAGVQDQRAAQPAAGADLAAAVAVRGDRAGVSRRRARRRSTTT